MAADRRRSNTAIASVCFGGLAIFALVKAIGKQLRKNA